ncbi:MAG: acyl-CoA transferase, partial [Actinomycetia bacterium]|nr:acyl-CoA transferase [Actinomycetes bacterium]
VIVHGYRPEALDRLGLGTERRHELRPGLIDVSLDAFGWTGPWSTRRGFDSLVQLSSGIADAGMVAAGIDKPKSLPVQALDHATGYLLAAAAVRGLRHRRTTGEGVVARCSLARTATMLIDGPRGSLDESFDPPSPERMGEAIEQTSWGPALRIHAPVEIGGVPPAWELPATALGMHSPRWTE